jgi:tetratricopeptide (TPR) repeat protein
MERAPVSLDRLTYRSDGRVLYRGNLHPGLGADHRLASGVESLALLVPHVLAQVETRPGAATRRRGPGRKSLRVGLFGFPWAGELCSPSEFERGVAALRARNPVAELCLRVAVTAHPRSATAACALGLTLLDQGREDEGVGLLEVALRENPDELRAARTLAGVHLKRRNLEAARALLVQIARADPEDSEAARLTEALGEAGR